MQNDTNIYDINDELIREAGDNHKMTIEEAEERIKSYRDKLNDPNETEENRTSYRTYVRNLQNYIANLYANLTKRELYDLLVKRGVNNTVDKQVQKAMENLRREAEAEDAALAAQNEPVEPSEQPEVETPTEEPQETVMDEYVQFEELPVSNETSTPFEESSVSDEPAQPEEGQSEESEPVEPQEEVVEPSEEPTEPVEEPVEEEQSEKPVDEQEEQVED